MNVTILQFMTYVKSVFSDRSMSPRARGKQSRCHGWQNDL